MFRSPRFLLACFILLLGVTGVRAQNVGSYGRTPRPNSVDPESVKIEIKPHLGETIPMGAVLYDHDRKPVTLGELVGGKPTILVPAYYRCPKLCTQVLTDLLGVLRDLQKADPAYAAGGAFNVVTFSVDPREDVAMASAKRAFYLKEYDGRSPEKPGWWFLSSTPGQGTDVAAQKSNVRTITNALGYPYIVRDQKPGKAPDGSETYENEWGETVPLAGSGFVPTGRKEQDIQHLSAVLILTPDGRISRYFTGVAYDSAQLKAAIVEANGGGVGVWNSETRPLLCMNYDSMSDTYKIVLRIMSYTAIPFALLALGLAGRTYLRAGRERKLVLAPPAETTEG